MSEFLEIIRGNLAEDLETAVDSVMAAYGLRFSMRGTGIANELEDMALSLDRIRDCTIHG